jgi:hypothetical protein
MAMAAAVVVGTPAALTLQVVQGIQVAAAWAAAQMAAGWAVAHTVLAE